MRERRYSEEEDPTTRAGNLAKKDLACLGCGRPLKNTDRCHRYCRACQRRNRRKQNTYDLPKVISPAQKRPYKEKEDNSGWNELKLSRSHYNHLDNLKRILDDLSLDDFDF